MLGLGSFSIFAAFSLCILSAIACVVYGIVNWNKGDDETEEPNADWEENEKKMTDKLDI